MNKPHYTPGTYEDRLNALFNTNKIKYNFTFNTQYYDNSSFHSNSTIPTTTQLTIYNNETTSEKEYVSSTSGGTGTTMEISAVPTTTDIYNQTMEFYSTGSSLSTTMTPTDVGPMEVELHLIITLIIALLLIVVSILSNSVTLHVLINNATLSIKKHYTNFTILSLTLVNLSTSILVGVPFLIKSYHACKVQTYFRDVNQIGVVWTLLAIFIDRGIIYLNPKYKWVTRKRFGSVVMFIWLYTGIVSFLNNFHLFTSADAPCPPKKPAMSLTYISKIIYLYTLPMLGTMSIILYLLFKEFLVTRQIRPGQMNAEIIWEIRDRHRPIHNLFNARPDLPRVMTIVDNKTESRQVLLSYVLVALTYYFLHLPNLTVFISGTDSPISAAVVATANLFSTSVNPIIYFLFRKDFRNAYIDLFASDGGERVREGYE